MRISISKKSQIVIVAVILLAVGAGVAIGWRERAENQRGQTGTITANNVEQGAVVDSDLIENYPDNAPDSRVPDAGAKPDQNVPGGSTGSSAPSSLAQPSGAFVSNHAPNLDGSPAPNTLQSVCITTAGARCTIRFIKDGVTKQLDQKVVNGDGVAVWDWSLQQIGLTQGSWTVEAVASNDTGSRSTQDSINLEVQP